MTVVKSINTLGALKTGSCIVALQEDSFKGTITKTRPNMKHSSRLTTWENLPSIVRSFPHHLNQETQIHLPVPQCPQKRRQQQWPRDPVRKPVLSRITSHNSTDRMEQTPQTEDVMRRENRFCSTEPTTDTSRSGDEITPGSLGRRLSVYVCVCVYARPRAIRRRRRRRLLYSTLLWFESLGRTAVR